MLTPPSRTILRLPTYFSGHMSPFLLLKGDIENGEVRIRTQTQCWDTYRRLLRRGTPHNTLCYECYQPGDVGPCDTCMQMYMIHVIRLAATHRLNITLGGGIALFAYGADGI
ncbi:hypothetical protein BDV34DRAFT_49642 [Aspergillus parasiticus]|uniref:Uncharacterized protein n=1 Tax=Aspergillus parasiticus TaxID=5067 RepID=A0A5N6DTM0_ASPPA|nr:hypothetical protein BDV34DRAFT_49642 [Aspergillus parasiticus]